MSCPQLLVISFTSLLSPFLSNSSELSAISPVVLRELWFPDVKIRWRVISSPHGGDSYLISIPHFFLVTLFPHI